MKRTILICFLVLAIGAVAAGTIYVHNNSNEKQESIAVVDENESKAYALVEISKESFDNKDYHTLYNTIAPVLDSYKKQQKIYTTFSFGDGTGLYFPFSDITKSGQYTKIDEKGFPTERIGDVVVNGASLTYKDSAPISSGASLNVYQYVPSEYMTDDLAICVDHGFLYVRMYADTTDDAVAQNMATDFCNKIKENGYDTSNIGAAYIDVESMFGYIVNLNGTEVTRDDSAIETVRAKMNEK